MDKKRYTKSYLFNPVEVKTELKNVDTFGTYSCPLTSSFGSGVLLNGIAQGTNTSERIGRNVRFRNLSIRMKTVANTTNYGQVRYAVVYDRQSNGTTPIASDIWNQGDFLSHARLANAERFVMVVDEICDSQQSTNTPISSKRYVKLALDTMYGSIGNTAAAINTGSFWLFMANNADSTIGVASTANYEARLRYTDC